MTAIAPVMNPPKIETGVWREEDLDRVGGVERLPLVDDVVQPAPASAAIPTMMSPLPKRIAGFCQDRSAIRTMTRYAPASPTA